MTRSSSKGWISTAPVRFDQLGEHRAARVEVVVAQRDLGAVALDRGRFAADAFFGITTYAGMPRVRGRERECGGVIPRRVRGDTAGRVRLRQRLHRVRRAAVLERADALQVLGLDEHLCADPLVERRANAAPVCGARTARCASPLPRTAAPGQRSTASDSRRGARVPGTRRTGTARRGRAATPTTTCSGCRQRRNAHHHPSPTSAAMIPQTTLGTRLRVWPDSPPSRPACSAARALPLPAGRDDRQRSRLRRLRALARQRASP